MPPPPAAPPSGRASTERLLEEAALAALQYSCSFEGTAVPPSIEEALLQACEWAHQVQQLEKAVVKLREASIAAESERGEHHAKLRAVQDVLAVVSQCPAAPPKSSSTGKASRAAPKDAEAGPSEAHAPLRDSDPPSGSFYSLVAQ